METLNFDLDIQDEQLRIGMDKPTDLRPVNEPAPQPHENSTYYI